MEIIEGNKLIAEFMGGKFQPELIAPWKFEIPPTPYLREDARIKDLKYNSDWNWLMPVVEKIELIEFEPKDGDDTVNWNVPYLRTFHSSMTRINRFTLHSGGTRIENTFNACIEFINWYNSQSK